MRRLFIAYLAAYSPVPNAVAQDTGGWTGVVEEVIVTAQKREERLQDTPIAATAFTGDAMRELGFDSSLELATHTPGLQMAQNFGEGNIPVVSIRGVGLIDFSEHNESPSAIYVDEVYKANLSGLDFQLFDLERAEALRGPQGTLFGRNATGGLVHYVTAKPTQEFDGYLEAGFGERGRTKVEGAVGGGLGEGVSGRVSALYHKHDGYYDNVFPGREDGNQLDQWALRAQVAVDPTDAFSMLLSVQAGENENDGGNPYPHRPVAPNPLTGLAEDAPTDFFGYANPSSDDLEVETNRQSRLETDYLSATLRLEWEGEAFSLISVSGYERIEKEFQNDPDASPNDIFATFFEPDGKQFSQEVRLQGATDNSRWVVGAYYMTYENEGNQTAEIPVFGIDQLVDWDMEVDTWALFGQYELDLSDRVTGVVGLRYTEEEKDYSNVIDTVVPGLGSVGAVVFDSNTVGDLASLDSDNVSFKAGLNYRATDDLLVYGHVSRAYKGGTFNMGFFPLANLADVPVSEEKLTSYEAGFKSTLSEGRMRLNGSLFYYDYQDHQAFLFDPLTLSNFLFNNDAEVLGLELELFASPAEGLDLILGISWLDAQLEDVQDPVAGGSASDRDMTLAPEITVNALLRYTFEVPWGGHLALQGDLLYTDESAFDAFNSPALVEDDYAIGNVRAIWTSGDERWSVQAFVENVADETYRTFAFDLGSAIGMVQDIYGKPRWWGASIRYSFR